MPCDGCLQRGLLLREIAGRIDRLVARGASDRARDLLALDDLELAAAAGLAPGRLPEECSASGVERLREELGGLDCWAVCRHDPDWPAELGRLGAAEPRALYGAGERAHLRELHGGLPVTVVGARRAGPYGLEVAAGLGEQLAAAGLPVVSGMALGADTAAHRGALRTSGLSVAVLGSGPERAYPRSAGRLYRDLRARGMILSELPPGSPTFRWSFPARNRVMAALGEITIVVEAAERSGTLITAEMAADCGRVVGAVPGPVNSWRSAGANMLIADGGVLVRDAQDVLDLLLGPGCRRTVPTGRPLSDAERGLLDAVEAGASGADALAIATGLGPGALAAALSRLELAGYLRLDLSGCARRTALVAPGDG